MKEYDEDEYEIHTGEVKPVQAPEDQLPDEYKDRNRFLEELSKLEPDSPVYPGFLQALRDLNQEIRVLTTPTKDGWPILNRERKDALMELYMETGKRLQQFLKQEQGMHQDAKDICLRLESLISKDYRALQNYDPASEKTILSVLEDARTTVYEYPAHETIRKVGGIMNYRYMLQMEGPDGKMIRGYFTEKDNYDCIEKLSKMEKQVSKKASTPEGANMILNFVNQYMTHYSDPEHMDGKHPADRTKYRTWDRLFKNLGAPGYYDTTKNKLVAEMATIYGVPERDITTKCGSQALNLMVQKISRIKDSFMLASEVGVPNGSRKDSRNSAMCTVAGLLGVSDLVAHARPMTIRKSDGTMIEGTFMEEAKGFDPNRPGQDARHAMSRHGRIGAMTGAGGVFFRRLSELQALDFICGNGDRHPGNLFYQLDVDGCLISVQGIDNDLSFGKNPKAFNQNIKEMVIPKNMGVLSKEMADRILQLKPEHLEFALKDQLESNAITSAIERLEYLQQTILTSRRMLPKDSNDIQFPYIRELSGDQWGEVNTDTLCKAKSENLFKKVWDDYSRVGSQLKEPLDPKNMTTIGTTNRAEFTGISQAARDAKHYEEELRKAVGKQKYATEDYRKLQEAVTQYREKAEKIYNRILKARQSYEKKKGPKDVEMVANRYVSRADLADMTTAAAKIKMAAETYYNQAAEKVRNNGGKAADVTRMKKMKEVTKDLHKLIKDQTTLRDEERKTLQTNQRRQTEDMLKQMKENKSVKVRAPR